MPMRILQAIASEQMGDAVPSTDGVVDAEVKLTDLMGPTFQALRKMEPFHRRPRARRPRTGVGIESAPLGSRWPEIPPGGAYREVLERPNP